MKVKTSLVKELPVTEIYSIPAGECIFFFDTDSNTIPDYATPWLVTDNERASHEGTQVMAVAIASGHVCWVLKNTPVVGVVVESEIVSYAPLE